MRYSPTHFTVVCPANDKVICPAIECCVLRLTQFCLVDPLSSDDESVKVCTEISYLDEEDEDEGSLTYRRDGDQNVICYLDNRTKSMHVDLCVGSDEVLMLHCSGGKQAVQVTGHFEIVHEELFRLISNMAEIEEEEEEGEGGEGEGSEGEEVTEESSATDLTGKKRERTPERNDPDEPPAKRQKVE